MRTLCLRTRTSVRRGVGRWVATLTAVLTLASAQPAPAQAPTAAPAGPAEKPAVLLIGGWPDMYLPLRNIFRENGFSTGAPLGWQEVTAEKIRNYDVVILALLGSVNPDTPKPTSTQAPPAYFKSLAETLTNHAKAGGGVLLLGGLSYNTDRASIDLLSQTLRTDAGFAYTGWQVVDRENRYAAPAGAVPMDYGFTTDIVSHAATTGVRTVYYPIYCHNGPGTEAPELSADWTVLVRGMKAATTDKYEPGRYTLRNEKNPLYPTAPPMAAVRDLGKGRIGYLGIIPSHTIFGVGSWAWKDIDFSRGDGNTPSDVKPLMLNLLTYLAAPGASVPEIGGFVEPPPTPPVPTPVSAPLVWTKASVVTTKLVGEPGLRGVMGLCSSLTTGQDTPAALIQKAKELGLDFVAFGEPLESLTPAKWEALKQVCLAGSDAKFLAQPGMTYRDDAGRRFLLCSGHFAWPAPEFLSADGKRLIKQSFWFEGAKMGFCGPFDIQSSKAGWWSYGVYQAWAVYTYEGGKQTEDTFDHYLYMNKINDQPGPYVLDAADSVAALTTAATTHPLTCFRVRDVAGLKAWLGQNQYYNANTTYISDGPKILQWSGENLGRQARFDDVPGSVRLRLTLLVTNDVPLREVLVYDGPELIRRFLPATNGFCTVIDLEHDRQRNPVAVAVDVNGRRAISGGIQTRDSLFWRMECSDRGNSICDSIQRDEQGIERVVGPIASYQRKGDCWSIMAGHAADVSKLWVPCTDGGYNPPSFSPSVNFEAANINEPGGKHVNARMVVPMSSRDALIQEDAVSSYYVDDANMGAKVAGGLNVWNYMAPTAPLQAMNYSIRQISYLTRWNDPSAVEIQCTVKLLQDIPAAEFKRLGLLHCWVASQMGGEYGSYVFNNFPQSSVFGTFSTDRAANFQEEVRPGSYMGMVPSRYGAHGMFALSDNLVFGLGGGGSKNPAARTSMSVFARKPAGDILSKGTEIKSSMLMIRGRLLTEELSSQPFEEFRTRMGIGVPPAYTVKPTQGKVRDICFSLSLDTQDYGFRGVITRAVLPLRLPIKVFGLNEHWSAGVYNLRTKEWLPFGQIAGENVGLTSLETGKGDSDVFIGNPVQCDRPEIFLTFLVNGRDPKTKVPLADRDFAAKVDVHNPLDTPVDITLRRTPGFDLIAEFATPLTIPAGTTVTVEVRGQ